MTPSSGTCALCGEAVAAEDALLHLRVDHGITEDVEEWPDGSPVVIDTTLEADDFKGGN